MNNRCWTTLFRALYDFWCEKSLNIWHWLRGGWNRTIWPEWFTGGLLGIRAHLNPLEPDTLTATPKSAIKATTWILFEFDGNCYYFRQNMWSGVAPTLTLAWGYIKLSLNLSRRRYTSMNAVFDRLDDLNHSHWVNDVHLSIFIQSLVAVRKSLDIREYYVEVRSFRESKLR